MKKGEYMSKKISLFSPNPIRLECVVGSDEQTFSYVARAYPYMKRDDARGRATFTKYNISKKPIKVWELDSGWTDKYFICDGQSCPTYWIPMKNKAESLDIRDDEKVIMDSLFESMDREVFIRFYKAKYPQNI